MYYRTFSIGKRVVFGKGVTTKPRVGESERTSETKIAW